MGEIGYVVCAFFSKFISLNAIFLAVWRYPALRSSFREGSVSFSGWSFM